MIFKSAIIIIIILDVMNGKPLSSVECLVQEKTFLQVTMKS